VLGADLNEMPIFQIQQGALAIPSTGATMSVSNPVIDELLHGHLKVLLVRELPRGAVSDLDERGGEVPGEEAEVRAAAVAGAGERPVLAGPPGRGEPREDDGSVGRHEAVDELRVGQRRSVHALHLPHHLHAAVHLVDRGRGKGATLASSAASLGLGRRRSWKCAVAESPESGATSRTGP